MEHANGSANGYAKSKNGLNGVNGINGMNGFSSSISTHTATPQRRSTPKPRRGRLSWLFSLLARLFTWYSILSILFRCPATLEECTDASPRICKPYFQLTHAVSPHVEPYYHAYAAPYLELARPYYETVDQRLLSPSWAYATKHGSPRVAQAQAFGKEKWEKTLQPELVKYQALAQAKYGQTLAPHVNQLSATVAPYYEVARTNALQTYHDYLLPGYVFVQPYAQQGYTAASTFTTETAVPSAVWAWNKTLVFLDGTVWPHVRSLYTENVEPQLLKIGQRLGRYNGNNTQKATEAISSTAAKADSTLTKPTSVASSASATPVSSEATTSTAEQSSSSNVAPPSPEEPAVNSEAASAKARLGGEQIPAPDVAPNESEVRRTARETVADDLQAWQEKYAKAADEGAAEIDDRIEEIAKRMIERQAKTMGNSLVGQLKDTVDTELATLKAEIQGIVSEVKSGSQSPEAGQEKVTAAVRKAGMEIKDRSQDIRNWRTNYETEMEISVTKFAEDHFKILDSIRDLALQKIGMKWAWMDGVTYKDWAKYHQLKERFDEWQAELKNLITSHPQLESAQNEGLAVEGRAMELAQSAAKELASLKQVAGFKIIALDDSDEFDPEITRTAAEEAEKAATAPEVEAETVGDEKPAGDEETATKLQESASIVAEKVESVASGVSDSAKRVVQEASAPIAPSSGSDRPEIAEASSAVLEETPVFLGNTTEATEAAQPEDLGAAHVPIDEVAEPVEAELSAVEEPEAPSATDTVKPAFLGAAAQSVPSRQPILDDDSFEAAGSVISAIQSDIPATISSAASSAYSAALAGAAERYSQALSLASAQVGATPKPAHEKLLSSVTAAYSNAVAAASSQLDAALGAAQHGLFATTATSAFPSIPTFVDWAHVESIAASRLNEGRSWAEAQYENAKIAIGAATPTPTDLSGTASSVASVAGESLSAVTAAAGANAEKLLQNAQYNYYAGLGIAQARYSEFLAAASSAFSSITATPTPTDFAGTLSSAASVASESAASVASAAQNHAEAAASVVEENASAAASVISENVSSVAAAGYDNIAAGYENAASAAEAAGAFAQENWNAVLDQVSAQIYGAATPTPWYESLYNAAGDYVGSATEALGGGADTVTSAAGSYATAASQGASEQYAMVSSIVSELLVGKEPTFSESVYSRLAAAYSGAADSASSFASAASKTVASIATEATEEVKQATEYVKDEL